MQTANDLLNIINTSIATGDYTNYTPASWITNTITYPSNVYTSYIGTENVEVAVRKYTEKVDKHVDQLEEDIEFLNKEREEHQNLIQQLVNDNINKANCIIDLGSKVEKLETLLSITTDMLKKLEDKVNGIN